MGRRKVGRLVGAVKVMWVDVVEKVFSWRTVGSLQRGHGPSQFATLGYYSPDRFLQIC